MKERAPTLLSQPDLCASCWSAQWWRAKPVEISADCIAVCWQKVTMCVHFPLIWIVFICHLIISATFFFLNKISLNQPRCHSDNIAISRKPKRRDATQVHLSWLVFEVCLLGKLWSVLVIHPAFMLDYCRHFTTAAVYIDTAGICCVRWPVEILAALLVKTKQKLLRKVKYPTTSFLIWLLLLLHPTKMV